MLVASFFRRCHFKKSQMLTKYGSFFVEKHPLFETGGVFKLDASVTLSRNYFVAYDSCRRRMKKLLIEKFCLVLIVQYSFDVWGKCSFNTKLNSFVSVWLFYCFQFTLLGSRRHGILWRSFWRTFSFSRSKQI